MLKAVLPPVITAYVVFVLMVLSAQRRPAPRPSVRSWWLGERRHGLVRYLIITTSGGYAVFLGIVVVFHTWLASERGAITSALVGGTALAVAVLGLFAGLARLPRTSHPSPDDHSDG
jgi:hypothetical protein